MTDNGETVDLNPDMRMRLTPGGVDIERPGQLTVRIQMADLQDVLDWLAAHGHSGRNHEQDV